MTNPKNTYIITIKLWGNYTLLAKKYFHRRDSMGNILRRVTAFLLGIVFTITSLVGGVVGGAYYAYKNVSPIEDVIAPNDQQLQDALGDLYGASIEELLDLITNAMDPEKFGDYTFDRLEKEYGLNLGKLLEKAGLDLSQVDQTSDDWTALQNVSILSLLSDPNKILDSTKLRALYVLVPAITGQPIDAILAPEAQAVLGDYTLSGLLAADEATGELGVVTAIKGLKVGALLPELFDSTFDVKTNQYIYSVKDDGPLKDFTFLNLIAEVPLQGVFNIVEGADPMYELLEGELKGLTSMRITDILNMFADVAGEEIAQTIGQYTQVFGDTTVRDLFTKTEDGSYTFAYENLLSGLEFGYLAGLTKVDGVWVDKEGNEPKGLLAFIADLSLGDMLDNKGDVVGMINAVAGDLTLLTVYETIFEPEEDGRYPAIVERLGSIKVSDILGEGKDKIIDNLKLSLKVALDGTTLRDAVYSFIDEETQAKLEEIPIVDALLNVRIDEFIRDEYTPQAIIGIFNDAIGDLTIGDIAMQEPAGNALDLLWDYRIGNILDGIIAVLDGDKTPTEVVDSFIGQYRVGDIFGAITGYEYSEAMQNWGKDGLYVAEGLKPLMNMSISMFVALFDKSYEFDFMSVVGGIQIADVAYTVLQLCGLEGILVKNTLEDGTVTYLAGGDYKDFAPLSGVVLTLTVNNFVNDITNKDFWLDRAYSIKLGDLYAYLINKVIPVDIEMLYANGKWTVISEYLGDLITNISNTSLGGVIKAFQSGDVELIKKKIVSKLGDTNIGDVLYAVLSLAGVKDVVVKGNDASGYQMATEFADFDHLATTIFGLSLKDIVNNATDLDWWFSEVGGIRLGDAVAYFVNKYATDMSATDGEDGWKVTGNLGSVLTALFNITLNDLRDKDQVQLLRDTCGELRVGDIFEPYTPEEVLKNEFVKAVYDITVNDILDLVQAETLAEMVYVLQKMFEGVTIGNILELAGIDSVTGEYVYAGMLKRIPNTEISFLLGLISTPDIVGEIVYEYGDLSVGEVVYTVLDILGKIPATSQALADFLSLNIIIETEVDGKYTYTLNSEYEDLQNLYNILFTVDLEEILTEHDGEYWLDRLGKLSFGDLGAFVINKYLGLGIELIYTQKGWVANSPYLATLIKSVANTTIAGVIRAFRTGDPELIKQKFVETLGEVNIGDLVYAALGFAGVKDIVLTDSTPSGYKIAYPELETLCEAVFVLKLSDIILNATSQDFWLNAFGHLTIGDAFDIAIPDEYEANKFVEAIRNISVNKVWAVATSETLPEMVMGIQDMFDGVEIKHILELAGLTEINNTALNKLADTELSFLIGLISSQDILGDIIYEFGDISLGDAIGQVLAQYIDITNPFVDATLGIDVETIIGFATAKGADDIVNVICDIYTGVVVGDIVDVIYPAQAMSEMVGTIFATEIPEIVRGIYEKGIITYLYEKFGDVLIGDIFFLKTGEYKFTNYTFSYDTAAQKWVALSQDGNLDELLTNVLNTKLGTIYNDVQNQETLREDLLTIAGSTTLGEFGKLVFANNEGIGVVDKVYNVKLASVINAIFDQDFEKVKNFACKITVDDVVGFLLPEEVRTNKFIAATFSVSANTVLNILSMNTVSGAINEVAYIYDGVDFGDIFKLFGVNESPLATVDCIYNAGIDDMIMAIAENAIVDYLLDTVGTICVGDIISDVEKLANIQIIPENLEKNPFVVAVTSFSVADALEFVECKTTEDVIATIQAIFNDVPTDAGTTNNVIIADVVELFYSSPIQNVALEKLAQTELSFLIGLAISQDIVGDLLAQYGDISIGDAVEQYLENVVDTDNFFLKQTFGIDVQTIYDMATADSVEQVLQMLQDIYGDATIGNIIEIFYDMPEAELLDTIATMKIMEIITHSVEGNFVPYIKSVFSKINIADLIYAPLAIVGNTEFMQIDGTTASGYKMQATYEELETLLQTGLKLGIVAMIENGSDQMWWLDQVGTLTIGNFVDVLLPEDIEANYFMAAVRSIDIDRMYYIAIAQNAQQVYDELAPVFMGVELKDALGLVGATDLGNEALAKLLDTSINYFLSLMITEDIPSSIRAEFGDITLGDAVAEYIPIKDNAFLDATYAFSVDHIFEMLAAATPLEALKVVTSLYENVTVGDVFAMAGVTDLGNKALAKLFAVTFGQIVGLFEAEDILAEIDNVFGSISVGDAIDAYLPEKIVANEFIKATLGFDVSNVLALIKNTTQDGILAVVKDVYQGVQLGHIVSLVYEGAAPTETVNTIYDLYINDIIEASVNNNIPAFLREKFGNDKIGDIVFSVDKTHTVLGFSINNINGDWFVSTEEEMDPSLIESFEAVLNTTIEQICGDVEEFATFKAHLFDVLGDTTVGSIASLAFKNEQGIGVVTKLYNLKLGEGGIFDAVLNGTILDFVKDFALDISIYDLVGFVLPEQVAQNAFVEATLSVNGKFVLNVVEAGTVDAILREVGTLYKYVTYGDIFKLAGLEQAPITSLNYLFNGELGALFNAIADGNEAIVEYVIDTFGGLSVNNIVTDIETLTNTTILGELRENNFVEAVLAYNVRTVYNIIKSETKVLDIADTFMGASVADIIAIFGEVPAESQFAESLNILGTINIGQTIKDIYNKETETLVETLTNAFNALPKEVKIVTFVVVGGAAVILYYVNNPLLVKIVGAVGGEDATWGEFLDGIITKALGYQLVGDNYVNDVCRNSLVNAFLHETATVMVTTGYPFLTNFKDYITIGNLLTAYAPLINGPLSALKLTSTAKGVAVGNELKSITDSIFNLPLGNFLTEDNKLKTVPEIHTAIFNAFHLNTIGDVAGYFMNLANVANMKANQVNGEWQVTGDILPEIVTNVMNVKFGGIYRGIKELQQGKTDYVFESILELLGMSNLGDIAYTVLKLIGKPDFMQVDNSTDSGYTIAHTKYKEFEHAMQVVFGMPIVDIVKGMKNADFWLNDYVGKLNVGDFVAYVLNNHVTKKIQLEYADDMWKVVGEVPTELIQNLANTTIGGTINTLKSGQAATLTQLYDTLGQTNFGDLIYLGLYLADVKDVMVVSGADQSGYALVGKLVNANDLAQIVMATTVKGLIGTLVSRDPALIKEKILSKVEDIAISDITAIFGYQTTVNRAVNKVLDTTIGDMIDFVETSKQESVFKAISNMFGDITLGDAFGPADEPDNAFLSATFGITVEDIVGVVDQFTVKSMLETIATIYDGVTLNDTISAFKQVTTTRAAVLAALDLDLGKTLMSVITENYQYVGNYIVDVFRASGSRGKTIVTLAVVGGGTALYFINNELLCKILTSMHGEGATFGVFAGVFGYELQGDRYVNKYGFYNSAMDYMFKLQMTTVLEDGYPLKQMFNQDIKPLLTVGNLLTWNHAYISKLEDLGVHLIQNTDGELWIDGNLSYISKPLFKLGLNDFLTENNKLKPMAEIRSLLYNTFSQNKLGDVLAVVLNRQKVFKTNAYYQDGKWVAAGTLGQVFTNLLNTTFAEAWDLIKNKNYAVVGNIVGDTTLQDIVTAFGTNVSDNSAIQKILSLKLVDIWDCAKGNKKVTDLIGAWTLGDLIENALPSIFDKNAEFTQAFLGMTLSELANANKQSMMDKFGEFKFSEVLGMFGYKTESTDEMVKAILDLKINIFEPSIDKGIETIIDTVKGLQLGEILGYKEVNGAWYSGDTKLTGVMGVLAGYTVTEVSAPEFFDTMKLGKLLGYDYDETNGVWLNNGTEVTGAMSVVADETISSITTGTFIDNTKLGKFLGYTYDKDKDIWYNDGEEVTGVMKTLAGKTVKEFSDTTFFNDMTVGELLGYTQKPDGWYDGTEKVTGIMAKLCDKYIGKLDEGVNELKIGDVIELNGTDPLLKFIDPNWEIADMSSKLTERFLTNPITVQDALDLGVLGKFLNTDESKVGAEAAANGQTQRDTITKLLNYGKTGAEIKEEDWLDSPVDDLLDAITTAISEVMNKLDQIQGVLTP